MEQGISTLIYHGQKHNSMHGNNWFNTKFMGALDDHGNDTPAVVATHNITGTGLNTIAQLVALPWAQRHAVFVLYSNPYQVDGRDPSYPGRDTLDGANVHQISAQLSDTPMTPSAHYTQLSTKCSSILLVLEDFCNGGTNTFPGSF